MADLKNLTFAGYEYDGNGQKVFSILRFDRSKFLLIKLTVIFSRIDSIINHFVVVLKLFLL